MDIETILILIVLLLALIFSVYQFVKLGKVKQIENIKQWLIYACLEAEKILGSKTGQVKLRYVYDLFVSKFKFVSYFISFELFSKWVDDSLIEMKDMINNNDSIRKIVEGDK